MIDTGTYLPFRVYDAASGNPEYSPNRKECEGMSHNEYFCMPNNRVLPFQISPSATITPSRLINLCDDSETSVNLTTSIETIDDDTFLLHNGTTVTAVSSGLYRLSLGSLYSDPFYMGDVSEMIHLKYRGTGITDNIYWKEGFYARCYINSVIEKPEYPILEERREDGEGDQHRVFQRWDKRHTIRFFGIESMADAMSMLPLMEEVEVNGTRVFDVEVDITWDEERECLAEIVITFSHRKALITF